jgi:hypothetical protein
MNILCCIKCGEQAKSACNCGVGYVPAHVFAASAVAKNPEKSDRAIAAEIGVSDKTVAKARKSGADKSAPKRIGRNGKKQSATKKLSNAHIATANLLVTEFDAVLAKLKKFSTKPLDRLVRTKHAPHDLEGLASFLFDVAKAMQMKRAA